MDKKQKLVLIVSSTVLLSAQPALSKDNMHHGTSSFTPELAAGAASALARVDSEGQIEGRFGRMFGLGKNYNGQQPLKPHPSPNYDLRLLGHADGPMNEGDNAVGDSVVPAGITFFGQFIDHDITLDVTTSLDSPVIPREIPNNRSISLDLDCVYGAGPEAQPYLYDFPKLVVGDAIGDTGRHDLPRLNGTAIIGDPRNDENVIISQIQAAFIDFHNRMVDELYTMREFDQIGELGDLPRNIKVELYEEARDHVLHFYHRVLVEDFLPQVIGAERTIKIATNGRKWYYKNGFYDNENSSIRLPFMPIEFSVAAYRFGHSQVRFGYKLNEAGGEVPLFEVGPGGLMGFRPIASTSVANWRNFFPVTGFDAARFQKARKIDTQLPDHLFRLDQFNVVPPGGLGSLASRNLNRGRIFRLPSGQELAAAIGEPLVPADAATSTTLGISTTPLWYYILQEASHVATVWNPAYNMVMEAAEPTVEIGASYDDVQKAGVGFRAASVAASPQMAAGTATDGTASAGNILGPVGGTIVGEVILGLLDHYREHTGKGLDYNPKLSIGHVDTGAYGRRIQMQHILSFAGHLEFDN